MKNFPGIETGKFGGEAPGGFGPPVRILQTLALPLGHGASDCKYT